MKFSSTIIMLTLAFSTTSALANAFDGQADNERDDLGYYYMITGGKFPTGTTPNGDNGSGGTFRYLLDDPGWGAYALDTWNKDDWFPVNASFAVTLKNAGNIVYDNNGIEDNTYGDYFDATGLAASGDKPGLYRGYSMSNNWDWIYAGYLKITQETTVDTIIGYYDENSGFDSDSPFIEYDMNIWSAVQDNPTGNPDSWMPALASFTGDVFSAKSTAGTFAWSYTGVDRIFGDDYGNMHDEIWRLTYTLDTPIVLQPGVYFFSHDAEIIPEPASLALLSLSGLMLLKRRH
ncbi:MAG: PEP-CTERM sorting domain-containing protein [Phycisphaeraceae bacterium]|nr:PEP-CTERM sorting domain-containing protein [Phycisphaeraceae bacterium]